MQAQTQDDDDHHVMVMMMMMMMMMMNHDSEQLHLAHANGVESSFEF